MITQQGAVYTPKFLGVAVDYEKAHGFCLENSSTVKDSSQKQAAKNRKHVAAEKDASALGAEESRRQLRHSKGSVSLSHSKRPASQSKRSSSNKIQENEGKKRKAEKQALDATVSRSVKETGGRGTADIRDGTLTLNSEMTPTADDAATTRGERERGPRDTPKLDKIHSIDRSRSPLSENGAAAVLKTLSKPERISSLLNTAEQGPSASAGVQRKKPSTVPPRSRGTWNSLELSEISRNMATGDALEVWVDPAVASPGGWARCTLLDMTVLETGACPPYFAFVLVQFDDMRVDTLSGPIYYKEWRPLALKMPSSGAPCYRVHLRLPNSSQRRGTNFEKGDRVEVKVGSYWCPATLMSTPLDEEYVAKVVFDEPSNVSNSEDEDVPITHLRKGREDEDSWFGMLQPIN